MTDWMLDSLTLTESLRWIIPEVMLAVGAIIILALEALAGPGIRKRIEPLTAVITVIAALLTNILLHVRSAPDDLHFLAFDGMLAIDAVTGLLRTIILVTLLLGYAFAWRQQVWTAIRSEFYAFTLLSAVGAIVMVQASHLLMLVLGLELLSLPLYTMAALRKTDARSWEAALKYFVLGSFASAILIFGMALLYGATGSVQYDQLFRATIDERMYLVGALFVLIGLLFKGGLMPFYVWSPDVYEGAPDAMVGLMAALAKVGAFGALIRLAGPLFTVIPEATILILSVIAALTMLLGNLIALAQTNLKRLLAYSSVAHAGYLLLGILAMAKLGTLSLALSAIVFYMATYLLTIVAAFALIALLQGPEGKWEIQDLAGAGQRHPGFAVIVTVLMFSLAGIPPLAGFFGKAYLFHAAVGAGFTGLAVFGILTSVISVFYYLRVIVALWFQPETRPLTFVTGHGDPWAGRFVVAWLLVLGLMPGLLHSTALKAARTNGQPLYFPAESLPDPQVRQAQDAVFAPWMPAPPPTSD